MRFVHESHYHNQIASVMPDEMRHYVDNTTAKAANYSLIGYAVLGDA